MMRKLIVAATILAIAGISPGFARGGHGHGHHRMHGHSARALSAPANPSVSPSLSSDPSLTGGAPSPSRRQANNPVTPAPGQLDPEDAKLDQRIKSICRGC
jgi:hypothetical protein